MCMSEKRSPKEIVREGYDRVSHAYRADTFDYEQSGYRTFLGWLEPHLVADMTSIGFPPEFFDAVIAFYSIIHVPLHEQAGLIGAIGAWLKPGGDFLASVGHRAWEGSEEDWRGVKGARMYWSHADADTYIHWLHLAGLKIVQQGFLPEGDGGHTVLLARKPDTPAG